MALIGFYTCFPDIELNNYRDYKAHKAKYVLYGLPTLILSNKTLKNSLGAWTVARALSSQMQEKPRRGRSLSLRVWTRKYETTIP